jgi:large subunit ribosomal protein L38e
MPAELKSKEEFESVIGRATECRVKLGYRRKKTEEGTKRVKVLKVKARTPSRLYTLVFDDIEEGLEFVRSLKERCSNLRILDEEISGKL